MRPGSLTWFSVAGPFAQFRPREPGWYGLPSSFRTLFVPFSTYATRPQAASQLKQLVGTSRYRFSTLRGHALESYSTQSSHFSGGGNESSSVVRHGSPEGARELGSAVMRRASPDRPGSTRARALRERAP